RSFSGPGADFERRVADGRGAAPYRRSFSGGETEKERQLAGGARLPTEGWQAGQVSDSDKPPLVISACLLGVECNHEGRGSPRAVVEEMARHYRLVPVCPEVLGGLPTPRAAAELTGGDGAAVLAGAEGARVVNVAGDDVTAAYRRGADAAV